MPQNIMFKCITQETTSSGTTCPPPLAAAAQRTPEHSGDDARRGDGSHGIQRAGVSWYFLCWRRGEGRLERNPRTAALRGARGEVSRRALRGGGVGGQRGYGDGVPRSRSGGRSSGGAESAASPGLPGQRALPARSRGAGRARASGHRALCGPWRDTAGRALPGHGVA